MYADETSEMIALSISLSALQWQPPPSSPLLRVHLGSVEIAPGNHPLEVLLSATHQTWLSPSLGGACPKAFSAPSSAAARDTQADIWAKQSLRVPLSVLDTVDPLDASKSGETERSRRCLIWSLASARPLFPYVTYLRVFGSTLIFPPAGWIHGHAGVLNPPISKCYVAGYLMSCVRPLRHYCQMLYYPASPCALIARRMVNDSQIHRHKKTDSSLWSSCFTASPTRRTHPSRRSTRHAVSTTTAITAITPPDFWPPI